MEKLRDPREAQALAEAIVEDLVLYHRDTIIEGIAKDTLFEVLAAELEEARALYRERVDKEALGGLPFMDRAIVDRLVRPRANVKTPIW